MCIFCLNSKLKAVRIFKFSTFINSFNFKDGQTFNSIEIKKKICRISWTNFIYLENQYLLISETALLILRIDKALYRIQFESQHFQTKYLKPLPGRIKFIAILALSTLFKFPKIDKDSIPTRRNKFIQNFCFVAKDYSWNKHSFRFSTTNVW